MKLLCDEDVGTGVPGALDLVGYSAVSLNGMGWGGKTDEFWLTKAGELEWLVLSCNKRMLQVKAERDTIIRASMSQKTTCWRTLIRPISATNNVNLLL